MRKRFLPFYSDPRYCYKFPPMLKCIATLAVAWIVLPLQLHSQNYLGAGNSDGISVTASSSHLESIWMDSANAIKTIDGSGMLADYFDVCRFLNQATLGFDSSHVHSILNSGLPPMQAYEAWIDDQMAGNPDFLTPELNTIFEQIKDSLSAGGVHDTLLPRRPGWQEFNYAWWSVHSFTEDLLRHRVATAFSEIFVISRFSDLEGYGDGLTDYYDMFLQNAFGNYRELIDSVTLHACMGQYLSHANNPKTVDSLNQHPDENYAREIMQLFSIGLYELNQDGSRKTQNGEEIPTYTNADINGLAKVLTGLSYGGTLPHLTSDPPHWGMGLWEADLTVPMIMYDVDLPPIQPWWDPDEDQHEDGPKTFLGHTITPNTSGMVELNEALDVIANHPNVGPFISRRLIQRLVKSNPSPQYISDVAGVFNNDGTGTRGNLGAVVKAILLHDEARDPSYQMDEANSRLQEPLWRYTHFLRNVEKYNPNGLYWNNNYFVFENINQDIFASPSVFNFFLPDDTPHGDIQDQGLVAPEFKLHDARSSVGYINASHQWTVSWGQLMNTWLGDYMNHTEVNWVIDDLLPLAEDSETYLNWLDKHILGGRMTDRTRFIIRSALNGFNPDYHWHHHAENRVRVGMHLALLSADYSITR